jgi:hypothetical protein
MNTTAVGKRNSKLIAVFMPICQPKVVNSITGKFRDLLGMAFIGIMKNHYLRLQVKTKALLVALLISLKGFSQENYSQINLDSSGFAEFEIMDSVLDSHRVYFTGENHTFASFNTRFELKFLKYLYETQNVRHFLFEQSPALGYIREKITIDKKTKQKLYLSDKFYEPFYNLVDGIAKFNDSLPNERKIRFHGIDIERFPYFSIYALNDMVEDRSAQFQGGEVFEQIVSLASSEYSESGAEVLYPDERENFNFGFGEINGGVTLRSIIATSYENRDSISVALGKDSVWFWSIIESVEVGIEWYNAERVGDVKSPIVRERFMQTEFERLYRESDSSEKFFGQFGRCHTHRSENSGRCYDYYVNSIASRISEIDSTLTNQVLVIPIFYSTQKEYDREIIDVLDPADQFLESGESFLLDLSYLEPGQTITGYDTLLHYAVVCNEEKDSYAEYDFKWQVPKTYVHLGFDYGKHFFQKFSGLNYELQNVGNSAMPSQMIGYTYTLDVLRIREGAVKYAYTWFLPVSNGERFKLGGSYFTVGGSYPFGRPWFSTALGLNYGWGRMWLSEKSSATVPNLFQSNGKNLVTYRNDVMILDPYLEIRISPRVLSINGQIGYAFDISSKYWKLDQKLKDYKKTSFSNFYCQVGISLHFGISD